MISFSDPFFITLFSCGIVFLSAGIFLGIKPPRKINDFYGYRTKASKQNQATWDFSQRYSARLMRLFGFGMMILSFGGWFLPLGIWFGTLLALSTLFLFSFLMIWDTEKAINRKFK